MIIINCILIRHGSSSLSDAACNRNGTGDVARDDDNVTVASDDDIVFDRVFNGLDGCCTDGNGDGVVSR